MSVSADFLRDLEEIDGSVESISTLSAYMRMHSGAAEKVVGVRAGEGQLCASEPIVAARRPHPSRVHSHFML
jgi:hypothetical protein